MEMRFVFIFKIEVLGTSRERHLTDFILAPLWNIVKMFPQKPKTLKQQAL